MTHRAKQRRIFQYGMRTYFAIATVSALVVALFWPRVGPPIEGCADQGRESVWISPPSQAEVLVKCKQDHPDVVIPANAPMISEKIFEEVVPCSALNFRGRRYLHRVRFRVEVYLNKEFPPESVVVMLGYDHYHLNGGGGGPVNLE